MKPIKLSGSNNLKLNIKNLDNIEKKVTAKIIVPKELTIEEEKQVSLASRDESSLSFSIEDFSARPNSNYAIFAIAEYEKDGKHYSSILPSNILIEKTIGISPKILVASLVVLLAIFMIYKLRKKNESKHSYPDKE